MFTYGTQLWVSKRGNVDLQQELMQPVINGASYIKASGGLWTSTYLGKKLGSEWIQWCIGNEFMTPTNNKWNCYLLEPKKNLKLLTIHTLEDMHNLYDTYGYDFIPNSRIEALDFERMAKDYDGMRLTSEGQVVTRHGFDFFGGNDHLKEEWRNKNMRSLYGWDCESTHHFKWNFKSIKPITLHLENSIEYSE